MGLIKGDTRSLDNGTYRNDITHSPLVLYYEDINYIGVPKREAQ